MELQREKEAEKLERQLALPTTEQAATQVSPVHRLSPPVTPLLRPTHLHLLITMLPRSLCFGRCARDCWRSLMARMSKAALSGQRQMMGPMRPPIMALLVLRRGWRRRQSSNGGGRRLLGSW